LLVFAAWRHTGFLPTDFFGIWKTPGISGSKSHKVTLLVELIAWRVFEIVGLAILNQGKCATVPSDPGAWSLTRFRLIVRLALTVGCIDERLARVAQFDGL
jgi:hypothetical protein